MRKKKKMLPIAFCGSLSFACCLSNQAFALQISDSQYSGVYNGQDMDVAQARFNGVTSKGGGGGVPIGAVVAWPASQNPEDAENWLECDGRAISQSEYPELYAIVGANVPDYRGLFLRGYGSNCNYRNEYGGCIASGALGAYQHYQIQRHSHSFGKGWYGGIAEANGGYNNEQWTNPTGGEETRPANKAVRYLIRAQ